MFKNLKLVRLYAWPSQGGSAAAAVWLDICHSKTQQQQISSYDLTATFWFVINLWPVGAVRCGRGLTLPSDHVDTLREGNDHLSSASFIRGFLIKQARIAVGG